MYSSEHRPGRDVACYVSHGLPLYYGLKAQCTPAQGNALGKTDGTNSALKGQWNVSTGLTARPTIPSPQTQGVALG